MGEFHKYPHIDGLHKVPEIFSAEEVVATEKVHGCNFRVMLPAGCTGDDVIFGSRNHKVKLGDGFYGDKPIEWFLEAHGTQTWTPLELLVFAVRELHPNEDTILYGEIYGAGIQKGVSYVDGDQVQFRAFDVRLGERFLDYDDFVTFCAAAALPTVPLLYRGKPTVEALNGLLEQNSVVAQQNGVSLEKNIAEGVVIRPTKMKKNHHDQWVLAKHKSVGFAEEQQGRRGPVTQKAYAGPHLLIADRYVTRGRLLNAREKAIEQGWAIKDSMADMQVLPSIVVTDVLADVTPEEREGVEDKQLKSAITRQVAIIYKALLNEQIGQAAE